MSRRWLVFCLLLQLCGFGLGAVTLEKLSLEEMIDSSTMIVRGTVGEATCTQVASLIRTEYRISVTETLKGAPGSQSIAVSLPGGVLGDTTQTFAGVPRLAPGEEYVFFLWRGASGRIQLVGLSQGLLRVKSENGTPVASRAPIDGTLLDRRSGRAVKDTGVGIRLPALRATVKMQARAPKGNLQ